MALDAIYISRLARELDTVLSGARVDKIHEPLRDDIVIALRSPNVKGKKLIISANASFPRVHLSSRSRENPPNAPMFCMLLRKHLINGRIISVSAPHMERIIDIKLEVNDEMGVPSERTLTCELMGRHSNIILRDAEDRVIECLKRVDIDMSEKRQVLPGLFYTLPPKQEKLDPSGYTRAELFDIVCAQKEEILCDKWIISTFMGFSPLVCREIAYRACGEVSRHMSELSMAQCEKMASAIYEICNTDSAPCIVYDNKHPYEFSYIPITQYENCMQTEVRESLSETLADFYETREARESMKNRSHGILQVVKTAHARTARKLAVQREELKKSIDREELRVRAELISANIYRLEKGMTSFETQNYFKNCEEVTIKLDPRYTPQENAEKLFREYRRMKNAERYITEQLAAGEEELEYLESVIESIEKAECEADLAEIREELRETGYADKSGDKKGAKKTALRPYRFVSSDGFVIYAGRNNKQNDALTLKSAMKGDLWLHTKNIPGSHVIVESSGRELPDRTITEAAQIAAYYSRAKDSENVPVDYTQVRHVKKPQGAAPGKVIYTNYYTAYVNPDEELCKQLSQND
ncbi:MAG: NFACT family protein [Oscillospiraceae bacterium]|nr:NFACT family protein [Oscillospiraceae bacterium]